MRTLILAAATAALLASPALAATKKAAAAPAAASNSMTAAPAAAAPAKAKGTSKMATCAAQWKALGATGQVKYNDQAKTMKSKKGGKLSGYNVWTGECMKKA